MPTVADKSLDGESRPPEPTRRRASDLDCDRINSVRSSDLELSLCTSALDASSDEEVGEEGDGGNLQRRQAGRMEW